MQTRQQAKAAATAQATPKELSVEDALKLAVALQQNGDRHSPRVIYQRVLALVPEMPEALHFLGLLEFQEGNFELAHQCIGRALAQAPDYFDAHINLGNINKEQDRLDEAVACFRRALELRPGNAAALNNLGITLAQLRQWEEAERLCREAVALLPDAPGFHVNLGHVLRRQGRTEESVLCYSQAALLDPDAQFNRGAQISALVSLGRTQEAAQRCREWLERDPDDVFARHHLAACSHDNVPARADDAYVRKIFDQFAGSFESKLAQLEYRAPQLIGELVGRLLPDRAGQLDIYDAGCGTGLCAPWLKPNARHLIGVDLSSRMVDLARARGVYDALEVAELGESLARHRDSQDLIVAADVLCYFGDLVQVMHLAAAALRPGGRVMFTVERHEDAAAGFQLHPHGRYSHAEAYVREALQTAGLQLEVCEHQVLRMESARPVNGLLVAAVRPA